MLYTDRSKADLFLLLLFLFMFHVWLCYAVLSVPCSLVITCWESADLLALLCFCHFPIWCPGTGPIIARLAITIMFATNCMLSGKPNHGWQLCFPL